MIKAIASIINCHPVLFYDKSLLYISLNQDFSFDPFYYSGAQKNLPCLIGLWVVIDLAEEEALNGYGPDG